MKNNNKAILNITAIKSKDKVYISGINIGRYENLLSYKINGDYPIKGKVSNWYEVNTIPEIITKTVKGRRVNERYELKEGYPCSDLTPQIIKCDDYDEYEEVMGLYTFTYDNEPDHEEQIEFKISIIDEMDDFKLIKEEFQVEHNFMDRLKYNSVMLPYRPCEISSKQAFEIIREHVKQNIDGRHARIKSDYNFHFEVYKVIQLAETIEYEIDVNNTVLGKKRKPKYEKRYRNNREITILNLKPSSSESDYGKNCEVPKPFVGNTYEEMIKNMNKYLKELITEINRPLCDCPHCNGMGVLEGKNE